MFEPGTIESCVHAFYLFFSIDCLNSSAKPPAGHFSLGGQRKVTKRKATLLLVFAAQKYLPSGTISAVATTGHPWPALAQLGVLPN
ncbi:MAG TPA: hypothetical protein PK129_11120 [Cellvibrionaceae bacterium]|nr:hypothetical protein [Cellvibrionaceae bacterium]